VVLSTQRSGSTWMVDMLTSHPRVVAYSELFMHGGEGTPRWGHEQDLPYWQTYIREQGGGRLTRPFQLWRYLGRALEERPGVDAIGFKLMYSQLTRIAKPLTPALWLKRVRIIHLMRRNALDVVLSRDAGEARRGVLHAREGQSVEAVRVRLRTDDLLKRLTAHERQIEGARVRFKRVGIPYTEVIYEDLVADEKQGFDDLFRFLGVEPAPVSSSLQKINPTSHEELIENYGEVREALEGTKFAGQLR
jgi:LPS sulfotransferase NodH